MARSPATLAECAAAGMTQSEAARALGISRRSVCRYAKKLSLRFPPYRSRRIDVWTQCAQQGMTRVEAAKALGTTVTAARMAAKRYGLKFRPSPRGRPPKLPDFNGQDGRVYRKMRNAKIPRDEALRVLGYEERSDGPR